MYIYTVVALRYPVIKLYNIQAWTFGRKGHSMVRNSAKHYYQATDNYQQRLDLVPWVSNGVVYRIEHHLVIALQQLLTLGKLPTLCLNLLLNIALFFLQGADSVVLRIQLLNSSTQPQHFQSTCSWPRLAGGVWAGVVTLGGILTNPVFSLRELLRIFANWH